jgi:hypothetical protein
MMQTFDPYYRWLGIPPHLQPPHHYRLLGLELFESDPDVIVVAADRQMTHVRMYQLGEYSDLSQTLLNELAAAKMCLLIPERKAAYDAELRKKLAAAGPSASTETRAGDAAGPTVSDDDELELAPVEPSREPHHPPAAPKSRPVGASSPPRGSPSPIGVHKPKPFAPPLNPLPSFPTDELPPANFSRQQAPPFLAESRRNFFRKMLKLGFILFLLVLGLMLFNAFALPWIKELSDSQEKSSLSPQAPVSQGDAPPKPKGNDRPLPPPPPPTPPLPPPSPPPSSPPSPPLNQDIHENPAPSEKAKPFLFTENKVSPPPAPPDKNPPVEKSPAQLRGEEFFVGRWRIYEDGRYAFSILLHPDFTARDSRHPLLVGEWEYKSGDARVTWNDGWRVVLRREGDTVRKFSFAPDDSTESHPVNEGTASKEEKGP